MCIACHFDFCAVDLCYPKSILDLLTNNGDYDVQLYCSGCLERGWKSVSKDFLEAESKPHLIEECLMVEVKQLFTEKLARLGPEPDPVPEPARRSSRLVENKIKSAEAICSEDLAARVAFVANTVLEDTAIHNFFTHPTCWKWKRKFIPADGGCLVQSVCFALGITPSDLLKGVHGFVNRIRDKREQENFHAYIDLAANDIEGIDFFLVFVVVFLVLFLRKIRFLQVLECGPDTSKSEE